MPEEEKSTTVESVLNASASCSQLALNTAQRQFAINLNAFLLLHNTNIASLLSNNNTIASGGGSLSFRMFLNGILARGMYQIGAVGPSKEVLEKLTAHTPELSKILILAATTATETTAGTPFELLSVNHITKVPASLRNIAAIWPMGFLRNAPGWGAVMIDQKDLLTKTALGILLGFASTIPNNFLLKQLEFLSNLDPRTSFAESLKFFRQNPRAMLIGLELRALSTVFGAFALSNETHQEIKEGYKKLFNLKDVTGNGSKETDISKEIPKHDSTFLQREAFKTSEEESKKNNLEGQIPNPKQEPNPPSKDKPQTTKKTLPTLREKLQDRSKGIPKNKIVRAKWKQLKQEQKEISK